MRFGHTKAMKTLTVNAEIRKRSPKWINLKTPSMRLRVDGRKRIFSLNAVKTLTSDVRASLFHRVALKQRLQAQIDSACALGV